MELSKQQASAIAEYVDPNKEPAVQANALDLLIEDVRNQKLFLEIIVRGLGESLTSMDDLIRSRGISLIAEILTKVPNLKLTPQNASTFGQFLSARLLDFPTVPNVIQAIHSLITNHQLHYEV